MDKDQIIQLIKEEIPLISVDENRVREIIRQELSLLLSLQGLNSFIFKKNIQIIDGRNIQLGTKLGNRLGTSSTQKIGLYGVAPVVQGSSSGEASGVIVGGGSALTHTATFNGNIAGTNYTISDIVKHLKNIGIILN